MVEIKSLSVIGAGLMGHGIALIAAQFGGYKVILSDIDQKLVDNGLDSISVWLKKSLSKQRITEEEVKAIQGRIRGTTDLKDAVSKSDFIIEVVTEKKEIKKALLKEVGNLAPESAIIVSNTSSIRITELAAVVRHPENFCGMHFFNPPQLMELVEITRGEKTSDSTVEKVLQVAHNMKKETVVLKKDCPGFIVNRILLPALNEAANLYFSGVADKEDIDKAIKLGLKWPMGPIMLIDQIGVDTVIGIDNVLGQEIDSHFFPNEGLERMREKGNLGKKTGKGFYDWTEK